MKRDEFINELKNRGFLYDVDNLYQAHIYIKDNIHIAIYDGGITEDGGLFPYTLYLNHKIVIGNKRCLSYIDEIIKKKE